VFFASVLHINSSSVLMLRSFGVVNSCSPYSQVSTKTVPKHSRELEIS